MSDDDKEKKPATPNLHQAKAFKATIVITRHDGKDPNMQDLMTELVRNNLAFAMPASVDGTVVISFSLPPREGLPYGSEKVLDAEPRLGEEKEASEKD